MFHISSGIIAVHLLIVVIQPQRSRCRGPYWEVVGKEMETTLLLEIS